MSMVEAAVGSAVVAAARVKAAAQHRAGIEDFSISPARLRGLHAEEAEAPNPLQALLDAGSRAGPAEPEGARLSSTILLHSVSMSYAGGDCLPHPS